MKRAVVPDEVNDHQPPQRSHTIILESDTNRASDKEDGRAHYTAADFFLGSGGGQVIALSLSGALFILLGGALFQLIQKRTTPSYASTVWDAYTYFVDPGTQTSLVVGDNSNSEISVAFLISLFGLLFMLCVTGIVVDLIRQELEAWRGRHARLVKNEHTLLIGWTDKTLYLLNEIALAWEAEGGTEMVVMVDTRTSEVDQEAVQNTIRNYFGEVGSGTKSHGLLRWLGFRRLAHHAATRRRRKPADVAGLRGSTVSVWYGDVTSSFDLLRASLTSSRVVLVQPPDSAISADAADRAVLATVLVLASISRRMRKRDVRVIAEAREADTQRVIAQLLENSQVILAETIMTQLLLSLSLTPRIGNVIDSILGYEGASDLVVVPPPQNHALDGIAWRDIGRAFERALPIGVVADDGRVLLNPSPDHVPFQTSLINKGKARTQSSRGGYAVGAAMSSSATSTRGLIVLSDISADSSSCDTRAEGVALLPTVPLPALGPSAEQELSVPETGGAPSRPKTLLVFGWRTNMLQLVSMLDSLPCVAQGSTVHLLAEHSLEWRQEIMARQGFDETTSLKRVTLQHHVGAPNLRACVARLPYATADVAIILADAHAAHTTIEADAATVATLVLLQDLREEVADVLGVCLPCRILCEVLDPRTRARSDDGDANAQQDTLRFFNPGESVSKVMAMMAVEREDGPALNETLSGLLAEGAVDCVPVHERALGQIQYSFWQMAAAIQEAPGNRLLIGYLGCSGGVHLNPPEKAKPRSWHENELLIVLRCDSRLSLGSGARPNRA